jgi:hypothetical protein
MLRIFMIKIHERFVFFLWAPENASFREHTGRRGRVTLLLRIREVCIQISDRRPTKLIEDFRGFSSVPPSKCRQSALTQATTASFRIISQLSLTYYPFTRRYIVKVRVSQPGFRERS